MAGQFVSRAFVVLLRKSIPQRATYKLPLCLTLSTHMIRLLAKGNTNEIASLVFQEPEETDKLYFGFTGATVDACRRDQVFESEVLFKDYLMEGFVKFKVRALHSSEGLVLEIYGLGSNRDKFLEPYIKSIIKDLGFEVVNA